MALISELGSGTVGAESYSSVAFTDTYFTNRAQLAIAATWAAGSTGDKEGSLRTATAYVDAVWGQFYRGTRSGRVQGLEWPRTGAWDDNGYPLPDLPSELQNAVCELAARALSAPLAADAARGGMVKRQKVDGAVEQEFFEGAPTEKTYGVVMKMLAPILDGTQGGIPQWNWR